MPVHGRMAVAAATRRVLYVNRAEDSRKSGSKCKAILGARRLRPLRLSLAGMANPCDPVMLCALPINPAYLAHA